MLKKLLFLQLNENEFIECIDLDQHSENKFNFENPVLVLNNIICLNDIIHKVKIKSTFYYRIEKMC